jgi:hypothetical protein
MTGVPTYVVGAGGVGCEVVSQLHDHGRGDPLGLLAIDADADALDGVPSGVPTIHLTSDSGIVEEPIGSYPYLSADVRVPATDANGQRHVGRYKLDNPVGTPFANHRGTIKRRVEQFYESQAVGIEDRDDQRYHLVVVADLGGGTGSGIVPVLAAVLDRIGRRIEGQNDADVRVLGVGVVPPLGFEPTDDPLPVEPVSYLNAYGALRNLSTLLGASGDDPVAVPVYSQATVSGGYGADGDGRPAGDASTVFRLDRAPFDAYWLVGADHGRTTDRWNGTEWQTPAMVARAIRALSECAAPDVDHAFQSRVSDVPPLGALGYGAVAVPHRQLRRYCERRRERDELQRRLQEVVERNISELQDERKALTTALERTDGDDEWFARVRGHLGTDPETPADLIDAPPGALGEALDEVAERSDLRTTLATVTGLANDVIGGRDGGGEGVCARVRSAVEETCREVVSAYSVDPTFQQDGAVVERVGALERELDARIERCRRRLETTDPGIRDLLPPVVDGFTSERERLASTLDRLESDRGRVAAARARLESARRLESLAEERLQAARERVATRLGDIDRDLQHFRRERADLRDALDELGRDIEALRRSLTDPPTTGATFVLPLRREAIRDVTLETLESELTSIAAYRDHGLLVTDDEEFEALLADCHAFSRSWPASVSQHEVATTSTAHHELSVVLYHRANESCVSDFVESVTGPDALRTSAQSSFGYASDPFRIEFVAVTHEGRLESLRGFDRLSEMRADGVFDALGHPYRDHRRALAYPEWYETGSFD